MKKQYCDLFDAYYKGDKWLEGKCCDSETSRQECYFECWKRPDIPCVNCVKEEECKKFKKEEAEYTKSKKR